MYASHYNFKELPFAAEPDARFIVLGEDHSEALATLVYAIDQQEGWALLLGEPGIGKTTLIIALLRQLRDRVIPAVITNPSLDVLDFYNLMALELGLEGPYSTKGQFLMALGELMQECRRQERVILLVVDEAQSLKPAMLEELRLLGNLDDTTPRVLNIFLAAQPEILRLLKRPESKGLLQRLRRHHLVKPMTPRETAAYIRFRLKTAGGDEDLFDDRALATVFQLTAGVPRMINSICDDALLLGYSRDLQKLDRQTVLDAAQEDQFFDQDILKKVLGSSPAPAPKDPAPVITAEEAPSIEAASQPAPAITAPTGPIGPSGRPSTYQGRQEELIPGELDEITMDSGRSRFGRSKKRRKKTSRAKASAPGEPKSRSRIGGFIKRLLVVLILGALVAGAYVLSGMGYFDSVTSMFNQGKPERPQLNLPPQTAPVPPTTLSPSTREGGAGHTAPERPTSNEGR